MKRNNKRPRQDHGFFSREDKETYKDKKLKASSSEKEEDTSLEKENKPIDKNLFCYENISKQPFVKYGNVFSANLMAPQWGHFIRLYASEKQTFSSSDNKENGWKVHIAVDPKPENLMKAWNIVKDILIDEKITLTKVIKLDSIAETLQPGKEITIYTEKDSEKDWFTILSKIDQQLADANIERTTFSSSDERIKGSYYLSYRNDKDENGNYIPAEDAKSFNESNDTDPFQDFQLKTQVSDRKDQVTSSWSCRVM